MKYCAECGKEIKVDVKFCPFCGAPQKLSETEEQPQQESVNLSSSETEPKEKVQELEPVKTSTQNQQGDQSTQIAESEEVVNTAQEPPLQNKSEQAPETISEPIQAVSNQQSEQTNSGNSGFSAEQLKNNETVQQLSKNGKNYLNYLNQNVKEPKIGQVETNWFGLINFILISLFSSLAISHAFSPIFHYTSTKASAFPYAIHIFLWIGLSLLGGVLVLYLVGTKIYKRSMSFLEAFDYIYAPNSLSVYISLFTFVLSFLLKGDSQLFYLFFIASFVLINITNAICLWELSIDKNQKNKFYIVVLSIVVGLIISVFVARIFGEIIVKDFTTNNPFMNLFGGRF
ncbi:hypothetical protein IGI37_002863 [Enterococcus sp. AZ194]|uniref:zinc ribbon domain-containing protein n=1 Tax=Enterococcus sp. AZ194 TaxID=2774629 RepID=UPI003F2558C6